MLLRDSAVVVFAMIAALLVAWALEAILARRRK